MATKCSNCGAPLRPGAEECSWCRGAVEVERPSPAASQPRGESDSPSAPRPLPAGWVRTVDPWAGYSVAHPPKWTARCEGGVITVSQDPSGLVQAFLWPIQLRSVMHAQQVAQEYFTWAKAQNRELEAWLIPPSEPFPRNVMLRTSSRAAGQRVEGITTISVCGDNALIRGFHGPADPATTGGVREAQTLVDVTGSFQREMPAPRNKFREPRQGSFDALAPVGWQATGRVRYNLLFATCEYKVRKDSAGLTQVVVPGDYWVYADGPMVGMCMLGFRGMRRFVPAGKYGPEVFARKFKDQAQRRVVDVTDCPQLLPRLYGDLSRIGLPPESAEVSLACVVTQHVVNGVRIRQKSFIATARPGKAVRWSNRFSGQWIVQLMAYYHAPESEFDAIEPILAGVADSFQINHEWVERQRVAAMQAAMIFGMMLQQQLQQQNQMMQQQMAQRRADITHTLHQTSDTIMSTWEHRNHVMDHINHQWSNVTLGRTDVVDPSYGTIYSLPNDYDQYWRSNSNYFFGGTWGAQPNPSWHELLPIKI